MDAKKERCPSMCKLQNNILEVIVSKAKYKYPKRLQSGEIIFKIIQDSIEATPVNEDWIGEASYKATESVLKFIQNNYRRRIKTTAEPKTITFVCIRCFKVSQVRKNGLMKCATCGSWAVRPEGVSV
jgi:hypothetical protein